MVENKTKFCQIRGWSLIFPDIKTDLDLAKLMKTLQDKKHGIYQGFMVTHTEENGKTHVHCGIILRKTPKMNWKKVPAYFETEGMEHPSNDKLMNPSTKFTEKLQTYFNYCMNLKLHEGQIIGKPYLYRWEPQTDDEKKQKDPADFLEDLIFDNLTVDDLDDNIDESPNWTKNTRVYALRNYDKLEKMIEKLQEIRYKKAQAALYKDEAKKYRHFQKELTKILDNQNDRNIHCHRDEGQTGKNKWLDIEGLRQDTLVLQSAETKRIAYAWNPRKHKRIIFDIPKHKMQFVNTTVIEKLKNGTLFSSMHHPKMKKSLFKPSIVILGNERIERQSWTEDRATYSTTNKVDYIFEMEQ